MTSHHQDTKARRRGGKSRPKRRRAFTAEEIERLREMVAAGLSRQEIARRLGRPQASVSYKIIEIGLPKLRVRRATVEWAERLQPPLPDDYWRRDPRDLTARIMGDPRPDRPRPELRP